MYPLYLARDRIEAEFLRDFLDRHLIDAVILGDYLSGATGELPANLFPTVWLIHNEDRERGRELLTGFLTETHPADPADGWTCAHCGESVSGDFDLCWNCNGTRPEPGPE
jgi:hypothetical protein